MPTVNITIQYLISSEALNTYNHAFGGTIGGLNSTFHHNLWACNAGRNPSVGMNGDFTFANNIPFNWHHRTLDGGDHLSYYNINNNYFKPGPATPRDAPIAYRILKPESERRRTVVDNFGKAYVVGNVVEGNPRVTANNWDGGVQPDVRCKPLGQALAEMRTNAPYPYAPLPIQSARRAYDAVLANAGATRPKRDAVDWRIVKAVRFGSVSVRPGAKPPPESYQVGFSQQVIDRIASLISKGIIANPENVGGVTPL